MKIAFLGLGNMGSHMARNLDDAGYNVTGFHVVGAALQAATEHGVMPADSAHKTVEDADVEITMIPAVQHSLAAYRDGLVAAAAPGTLFIDSSTIAVDDAVQAAEMAHDAGHLALDAPVSGGTAGAEKGALTFMVGGSQEAFDTARPLFEVMGRQIVHAG